MGIPSTINYQTPTKRLDEVNDDKKELINEAMETSSKSDQSRLPSYRENELDDVVSLGSQDDLSEQGKLIQQSMMASKQRDCNENIPSIINYQTPSKRLGEFNHQGKLIKQAMERSKSSEQGSLPSPIASTSKFFHQLNKYQIQMQL